MPVYIVYLIQFVSKCAWHVQNDMNTSSYTSKNQRECVDVIIYMHTTIYDQYTIVYARDMKDWPNMAASEVSYRDDFH